MQPVVLDHADIGLEQFWVQPLGQEPDRGLADAGDRLPGDRQEPAHARDVGDVGDGAEHQVWEEGPDGVEGAVQG
ncbi:MAG: hypothetical protein WD010_05245 [Nitriliruptor sp.]